ncbi:MAG TPA: four helix bundle protein [Candidatus Cloacimonas sp.]|jgi:four helix bundle protein|nr:four helix bundle protein [Candidatus Cloacimonas sp.]MDD2250432.1 four helix bundle protein [Candidatus Cloacimonadota bacterium]MCK9158159.1 four helix bundle protein [Candidatus Cloacimonas sp.]MCK9165195.1 four helix bundle protein [Candidatus Cloacimonas sp.]MDD3734551.1 four helix bundle protein [Candidatus Cloacimonadota bacterium]
MSGFKQLKVWQVGMDLVIKVYKITESFPKSEMYGLISQLRRCSVSIPSNIAEGSSRNNPKEFAQFLYIAQGSLSELDTQFTIAQLLGYIQDFNDIEELIRQIRSMLTGLIKAQKIQNPQTKF